MSEMDLAGNSPSEEPSEISEESINKNKVINEEYKVWKKHAPFLYDVMMSRALDWPTLTTQWLPDVRERPEGHRTHRLLLGTHTTENKPNYVQIADVQIPILQTDPEDYDAERGEIGGYGAVKKPEPEIKFTITQRIEHPGEVNKARYMPQNPDLISTMCNNGKVLVFDRTKHTSAPEGHVKADIELRGHKGEGYAMNWNMLKEGTLATGDNEGVIHIWDIQQYEKSNKTIKPSRTLNHHSASVNAVEFHWNIPHMLASVSDDKTLQVHDLRVPAKCEPMIVHEAHNDEISCVSFNLGAEVLLATGSYDSTIGIWDLRCLKDKLHACEGHKKGVSNIEWHPFVRQCLYSSGLDRRINIWNLSKTGEDQTPEDAEDGPPELIFMHGGHTDTVSDFSLNKNDPYLTVSAAEDNLMQIWKPTAAIVGSEKRNVTCGELEKFVQKRA